MTTHDFLVAGVGSRFGARLAELRAMGYRIDERRLPLPTRGSRYRLVAEPDDLAGRQESRRSPGQAADVPIVQPDQRATKGSIRVPAAPVAQQAGSLFDPDAFGRAA